MKLEKSFIKSENEGKINWDPNGASTYTVVNKDKPNQFGEYGGYRIAPGMLEIIALDRPLCIKIYRDCKYDFPDCAKFDESWTGCQLGFA